MPNQLTSTTLLLINSPGGALAPPLSMNSTNWTLNIIVATAPSSSYVYIIVKTGPRRSSDDVPVWLERWIINQVMCFLNLWVPKVRSAILAAIALFLSNFVSYLSISSNNEPDVSYVLQNGLFCTAGNLKN